MQLFWKAILPGSVAARYRDIHLKCIHYFLPAVSHAMNQSDHAIIA
jgi:hypothetical protein